MWLRGSTGRVPMHELAISQSLVSEAARVAAEHGAERVTGLVVVIGALSGVEAPLLERAFSIAKLGSVAEHAVLQIEEAPVVVWCPECERESPVRPNALLCAECGGWRVTLRSGDELLLKRVEMAVEAAKNAVVH